jgi:hypothetical protein
MRDYRSVSRAHFASRAGDALEQRECLSSLNDFVYQNACLRAKHGSKQATVRYPTLTAFSSESVNWFQAIVNSPKLSSWDALRPDP